ncbi:MAG: hypothetical protein EOO75_03925, partial [Myxococcales bacterium]
MTSPPSGPRSGEPDAPAAAPGEAGGGAGEVSQLTNPLGGNTLWLTQTPSLSLWRGEVGLGDWLRLEGRDGFVLELPLDRAQAAVEPLRVGRLKAGMPLAPNLQSELFVSSQAARLRHDGVRWWLERRRECHEQVPTVVGARALGPGEEAPLVHGTFVQVGRARGTLVDRRYAVRSVPAGAVDEATGLLGRVGFEQEVAGAVGLGRRGSLIVLVAPAHATSAPDGYSPWVRATMALHARWPRLPVLHQEGLTALLASDESGVASELAGQAGQVVRASGVSGFAVGHWPLGDDGARELELALYAAQSALAAGSVEAPLSLRRGLAAGRRRQRHAPRH